MGMHVSITISVLLFFPAICPGVELLTYRLVPVLAFWGTSYCFPQWLQKFIIPPSVLQDFPFYVSLPTFVFSGLLDDSHSDRHEVISHCGLICIFLMIRNAEHLFMYLMAICMSSLESCLFRFYVHLKKYWLIVDLQCCVSVRCTAKWISYIFACIHSLLD